MSSINFKANLVHQVSVKKLDNNKYIPAKVSFVELCPDSTSDLSCLGALSMSWKGSFARGIYYDAYQEHVHRQYSLKNTYFYAITEQKEAFEKLHPNEILGLVEFLQRKDCGPNKIIFLQTNPNCISHPKSRYKQKNLLTFLTKLINTINPVKQKAKYKYVGSSMINSLKTIFPDDDICLQATEWARGFYKKLGFKTMPQLEKYMILKK